MTPEHSTRWSAPAINNSSSSSSLTVQEQQEKYVICIRGYSLRRKEQTIYPGDNFRQLAQFLSESTQNVPSSNDNGVRNKPSKFVVIHLYENGREKQQIEFQDSVSCLEAIQLPSLQPQSGSVIFMRGFPSSHWLKILGTHYRVDPEFFRRHLEISQSKVDYKLSYLYSSGPRIVRLRVTDIFVRPVTITEEELISKRQEAARALRKYQMQLGAGGNVGESIIRRISYHDGTYFTIEHDISIYLKRSDRRGWYALVWNDVGRDLSQCPSAPWTRQGSSADQIPDLAPVCQPIRMYRERGSLAMNKNFIASASINRTAENLYQSSCLLPQAYGSSLNAQFIPDHPMYALSEIFSFAATSEHQFLSLIASLIHNEVYSDSRPPEFAVTNLKYAKDLLDDHANSIQDNMRFLIKSDCVVTESRRDPSVDDRVKSVIEDYTTLLDTASKLSALCLQGMTIIANEARLKEARNSSAQSKRSETLTLLAFFYLPLTLAASLFGMNVVQLGQGSVSIGWALLALFGFLMFQMAIYYGAKRVNEVVGLVDERLREALR